MTGIAMPDPARTCEAASRRRLSLRAVVLRYLVRRLLLTLPSLLAISVVLFRVLALAPGDPFSDLATDPSIPPSVAGRAAHQIRPR